MKLIKKEKTIKEFHFGKECDFILLYLLKKPFGIAIFDRLSLRINGFDDSVNDFFKYKTAIIHIKGRDVVHKVIMTRWFVVLVLNDFGKIQANHSLKKYDQKVITTNIFIQLLWFLLWVCTVPFRIFYFLLKKLFTIGVSTRDVNKYESAQYQNIWSMDNISFNVFIGIIVMALCSLIVYFFNELWKAYSYAQFIYHLN